MLIPFHVSKKMLSPASDFYKLSVARCLQGASSKCVYHSSRGNTRDEMDKTERARGDSPGPGSQETTISTVYRTRASHDTYAENNSSQRIACRNYITSRGVRRALTTRTPLPSCCCSAAGYLDRVPFSSATTHDARTHILAQTHTHTRGTRGAPTAVPLMCTHLNVFSVEAHDRNPSCLPEPSTPPP